MDRTRIMLARLPRMLREILERAAEGMRIDVVAVVSDVDDVVSALVQWCTHAIVLGASGDSTEPARSVYDAPESSVSALLAADVTLCIMTVSDSGRVATVHRTNTAPLAVDNVSPHDLLRTLESSVGAARTSP